MWHHLNRNSWHHPTEMTGTNQTVISIDIYKKANHTEQAVIAILHFNKNERARALKILKEIKLDKHKNIILIDGEEKPSASHVKNED